MKSLSSEIKKEEATLDEVRRLANTSKSKSQILDQVDALLLSKGHQDALGDLGVRVYLLAHDPGENVATIIPPMFPDHLLGLPDSKGCRQFLDPQTYPIPESAYEFAFCPSLENDRKAGLES